MEKVRTCLVIGAAPLRHGEDLRRLYHPGDFVVCADGGLELAQKWGIQPDLAVGDFDSFHGDIPGDLPVVPLNPHKDDTDTVSYTHLDVYKRQEQECVEGCLSFPGEYGITKRPYRVLVRAQDRSGKFFELASEGFRADACCHEIDHLDGINFKAHTIRMLSQEELENMK